MPKMYNVTFQGKWDNEKLEILRAPMMIDGYRTKGADVELTEQHDGGGKLKITLYEGRNREIRKMCEQVHLAVRRLCRVQIGEIRLSGLALGKWRFLNRSEVEYLMRIKRSAK